ncbi:MAG: hypothetical protein A2147_06650 [Chloroflexi bacterium RBG_16_57_8]|nr:MAG: hypothetical protein A2147_06650 [Chloroflexi bacterium RBG_16_57_8]
MEDVILIVEDEVTNQKLFRNVLESRGYTVVVADDGRQAVEIALRQRPSLVLMDIGLPGMNGLDVTRCLKGNEHTRDIVVVALTAYATKEDQEKALEAGCDGFLAKPIDIVDLVEEVARHLTRPEVRHHPAQSA